MQWNEITYGQLLQLQALGETATPANILKVLYPGAKLGDIPTDALAFMDVELQPDDYTKVKKTARLSLGTQTYILSTDWSKLTLEQWDDMQAFLKQDDTTRVLACMITPETGYGSIDLDDIVEDIMQSPCTQILGLVNFITASAEGLLRLSLLSSLQEIMKNRAIPLRQRLRLTIATMKFLALRS